MKVQSDVLWKGLTAGLGPWTSVYELRRVFSRVWRTTPSPWILFYFWALDLFVDWLAIGFGSSRKAKHCLSVSIHMGPKSQWARDWCNTRTPLQRHLLCLAQKLCHSHHFLVDIGEEKKICFRGSGTGFTSCPTSSSFTWKPNVSESFIQWHALWTSENKPHQRAEDHVSKSLPHLFLFC